MNSKLDEIISRASATITSAYLIGKEEGMSSSHILSNEAQKKLRKIQYIVYSDNKTDDMKICQIKDIFSGEDEE